MASELFFCFIESLDGDDDPLAPGVVDNDDDVDVPWCWVVLDGLFCVTVIIVVLLPPDVMLLGAFVVCFVVLDNDDDNRNPDVASGDGDDPLGLQDPPTIPTLVTPDVADDRLIVKFKCFYAPVILPIV